MSPTASLCFDGVPLGTARLLLRPPQAGDAPALLQAFSDAQAMRYWSTPRWIVGDERCDSALYGLLASEWQQAA